MKRIILDSLPSEETKLKMAGFFMETLGPRVLAARKGEESAKTGRKRIFLALETEKFLLMWIKEQ